MQEQLNIVFTDLLTRAFSASHTATRPSPLLDVSPCIEKCKNTIIEHGLVLGTTYFEEKQMRRPEPALELGLLWETSYSVADEEDRMKMLKEKEEKTTKHLHFLTCREMEKKFLFGKETTWGLYFSIFDNLPHINIIPTEESGRFYRNGNYQMFRKVASLRQKRGSDHIVPEKIKIEYQGLVSVLHELFPETVSDGSIVPRMRSDPPRGSRTTALARKKKMPEPERISISDKREILGLSSVLNRSVIILPIDYSSAWVLKEGAITKYSFDKLLTLRPQADKDFLIDYCFLQYGVTLYWNGTSVSVTGGGATQNQVVRRLTFELKNMLKKKQWRIPPICRNKLFTKHVESMKAAFLDHQNQLLKARNKEVATLLPSLYFSNVPIVEGNQPGEDPIKPCKSVPVLVTGELVSYNFDSLSPYFESQIVANELVEYNVKKAAVKERQKRVAKNKSAALNRVTWTRIKHNEEKKVKSSLITSACARGRHFLKQSSFCSHINEKNSALKTGVDRSPKALAILKYTLSEMKKNNEEKIKAFRSAKNKEKKKPVYTRKQIDKTLVEQKKDIICMANKLKEMDTAETVFVAPWTFTGLLRIVILASSEKGSMNRIKTYQILSLFNKQQTLALGGMPKSRRKTFSELMKFELN